MAQLYMYKNEIRTMGEMQAIWIIECIKEPFETWLQKQEKLKAKPRNVTRMGKYERKNKVKNKPLT